MAKVIDAKSAKQVVASLAVSAAGTAMGALTIEQLDLLVSEWIEKGYTLSVQHYLGEVKDRSGALAAYRFAYLFVKEA